MLKSVRIADTTPANHLVKLWAARYVPDLSLLPTAKGEFPAAELVESASQTGRAKTVGKLKRFLPLSCEVAGLESNALLTYVPNLVNLAEARRLAQYVEQVYEKTLAIYKQQPPPSYYLKFIHSSSELFSKLALPTLMLPMIQKLAEELEPVMVQLQNNHLLSRDSRTIGFLTTQFHFTNRELLKQLAPCEQVLLTPYLRFIEEQICIPWQRLCAAAAHYLTASPALRAIEQLMPLSHEIAGEVYQKALHLYPEHRSRRGRLNDLGVTISTLRDLNMFQGYLWLCILEESMAAVEQELLPLCVAVFPSIGVRWELVELMLRSLEESIESRITREQMKHIRPYTQALLEIFSISRLKSVHSMLLLDRTIIFSV